MNAGSDEHGSGHTVALCLQIAAGIALAACSPDQPEPQPAQEIPSPADIAGTYKAKLADGSIIRQTLNADGTYLDLDADGNPVENGTWRLDGKSLCYDPEGSEPEACYDQGPTGSVTRIEEETAGPE